MRENENLGVPKNAALLSASYAQKSSIVQRFPSRFMTEGNLNKYGIGQRDGTAFVMPSQEANSLLESTAGNARALEEALGLPENFLEANKLVRVDIQNPKELNLRVPSGNEAGANELWIPGGRLPDGNLEAVIDVGGAPTGQFHVTPLSANSSGNAQVIAVESHPEINEVQYGPANDELSHAGEYYQFTNKDGSQVKVIDPSTYEVAYGGAENQGNTTFRDLAGNQIVYDPASRTWKKL